MPRFPIDLSKPLTFEERRELERLEWARDAWYDAHGVFKTRIAGFKIDPSDENPRASPEFGKKIKEAIEIIKKHLRRENVLQDCVPQTRITTADDT
jgi:hypothetical protein